MRNVNYLSRGLQLRWDSLLHKRLSAGYNLALQTQLAKRPTSCYWLSYFHGIAESTRSGDCLWRALFVCWVQVVHAHGLPWDLWLVKADGTRFERLTEAALDSPYPAWSPAGKFIGFMDFTGIYVVDRQQRTAYRVSTRIGHGSLDWK